MIKTSAHKIFDETQLLDILRHYLPTQGPLKDFVHHNTLHAFQDKNFYDAIFKASQIFGYQVTFSLTEYRDLYTIGRIRHDILEQIIRKRKGEAGFKAWYKKALNKAYDWTIEPRVGRVRYEWRRAYPIELDNAVQPIFFRILCSYLDQGIAITPFPFEQSGLLNAVRRLDALSPVSFFKTKKARTLLHDSSITISSLLHILIGNEALFEEYIFDQQFSHRGWSGMVATLEEKPDALLYPKKISLQDAIILELLIEIDTLEYKLDGKWKPLGEISSLQSINIFADTQLTELQEVLMIWQDAFEWSYYDEVMGALRVYGESKKEEKIKPDEKSFQAIFCIDEREYSLRHYVETADPACETFGAPGFFGVEFYFHPAHAQFYEKLCPAPVSPKYLIKEIEESHPGHKRKQEVMYTKSSHTLMRGFLSSYLLGIPSLAKLVFNIFYPTMSPAIADAFDHMDTNAQLTLEYNGERDEEKGLQVGFTTIEMADRVEKLLRGIGLIKDFSPLVYVIAHGSSSANNPHHGAHDCGACSGRPGAVNSRVFAAMANNSAVREELAKRGLKIPNETCFIGGLHDTAADLIAFFDEQQLDEKHSSLHRGNKEIFEKALDKNAKERSRRFMSINTRNPLEKIREDIKKRSVSYFEPRPELGHGTNALCILGRRSMTKDLFLDRRAFLNSYDYTTDPDGKYLLNVITPLPTVCGGINLEYYFSRMDNYKLGAGTKLPHNVMGLIGVANSSDGDLRPGLPLQMIEVHDPIRLLMIVEHRPEVVLKVISSSPALYEWFINEWVHLTVFDPVEKKNYIFEKGAFVPYTPLLKNIPTTTDVLQLVESVEKMKTNHILDATRENIPVHIITK
jgi:uncharacterized protein YbcC (UPF0753/DUF2309 family)